MLASKEPLESVLNELQLDQTVIHIYYGLIRNNILHDVILVKKHFKLSWDQRMHF